MKTKVTHMNATEHSPHRFVAEASELGLRPGSWPIFLETDFGNRQPFFYQCQFDAGVTYFQRGTCLVLNVLND